jgi:hypothetical protein
VVEFCLEHGYHSLFCLVAGLACQGACFA